ncbi:Nucleotidyltransferase [Sparassis latifolia]
MPFKRPAPQPHEDDDSQSESSSSILRSSKHARLSPSDKALPEVKIYIVQAKLDVATISELFLLAERHTAAVCRHAEDADVIITAVSMRRRLERHVPWELAKTKAVVTPDWLRDSIKHGSPLPCGDYVALKDLHEETITHCPLCNAAPCACSDSSFYPSPVTSPAASRSPKYSLSPPHHVSRANQSRGPLIPSPGPSTLSAQAAAMPKLPLTSVKIPSNLQPPFPPIPTNTSRLNYASRYACQRASPLVCPNGGLVAELDIMHRTRTLEGEARSSLSYQRAVSVIKGKSYPHPIKSLKQVEKLPFIGTKIGAMVEEFAKTGKITEAQKHLTSERFQTLSLFSSIYGIGPTTARRLYNLGLRSLEDLEVYYGVDDSPTSELVEVEHTDTRSAAKGRHSGGEKDESDEGLGENWTRIALGLRADLSLKIPRGEVEEMGKVVMAELDELEPGCVSTIVGGYRRGKPENNDVDIVFTHPDPGRVKGLCKRFVSRLHERGMVTHVMHLSGFHGHNPLRTTHWDSLEKSLTVFVLPPSSPFARGVRRRLDLIFAPPEVYWTAVVGWSGSIMFQRDLRQWAKDKFSMKFDSSAITRRYDSKQFFPKTEKEVFDLFELEWIDPTLRNADA